jgi:hypothetical protein
MGAGELFNLNLFTLAAVSLVIPVIDLLLSYSVVMLPSAFRQSNTYESINAIRVSHTV